MPTTVTGTLVDKNGQRWAFATVQLIFQPATASKDKYTYNGVPYAPGRITVTADANGTFGIVVPANNEIQPTNSEWILNIGPDASSLAYVAAVYLSTGALDISAMFALEAEIILVQSTPLPRAYNDSEVATPPNSGQLYYDVTTEAIKFFENGIWNPIASAIGSMIYPPPGVAVSAGNSWAASIPYSSLVQYPPAGIPTSTGTGWGAPIDPATIQGKLTLTTNLNSGPATLVGNTLNIPQYSGGAGGMVYPAAGIALSNGSAWLASIPPARVAYVDVSNTFASVQNFSSDIHVAGNGYVTGNVVINGSYGSDNLNGSVRIGYDYTNPLSSGGVAGQEITRLYLAVNGQSGAAYSGEFRIGTTTSPDINGLRDFMTIRHYSGSPSSTTDLLVGISGAGDFGCRGYVSSGGYASFGLGPIPAGGVIRYYASYIYNNSDNAFITTFLGVGDNNARGIVRIAGGGAGGQGVKTYADFTDGQTLITDKLVVSNALNLGNMTANSGTAVMSDGTNLIFTPNSGGSVYLNWGRGVNTIFGGGDAGGANPQAIVYQNGSMWARDFTLQNGAQFWYDGGSTGIDGMPNGRLLLNYRQGESSIVDITGSLSTTQGAIIRQNLNCNSFQIQATAPAGYVLMGDGTHYVPQQIPPSTTNASPSGPLHSVRAFGPVYQNTSGGTMLVSGYGNTTGSSIGSVAAYIGSTNPPGLPVWANTATATVVNGTCGFFFAVPNGWYYQIRANTMTNGQGSAVNSTGEWIETILT